MTDQPGIPTAEVDPLFTVDEPSVTEEISETEEEEKTEAEQQAKLELEEHRVYRELVVGDPFYKEATPSVRKMLSYRAWKSVKERAQEPDIGDVCLGSVIQAVEIIPGKLVPQFRMLTGKEWRFVLTKLSGTIPALVTNRQALYRLAFGLYALDGMPVWASGIINQDKSINEEKVDQIVAQLEERPLDVLHLLSTHYEWFRARMHLLLEGGQVKNG